MPDCRSQLHEGDRRFRSRSRGRPPHCCGDCDAKTARRHAAWRRPDTVCIHCGLRIPGDGPCDGAAGRNRGRPPACPGCGKVHRRKGVDWTYGRVRCVTCDADLHGIRPDMKFCNAECQGIADRAIRRHRGRVREEQGNARPGGRLA